MPETVLRSGDAARTVAAWAVATASLAISAALLPGLSADSWVSFAAAALVSAVVGGALRPVLVWLAAAIGWLGVTAVALAGQAVVIHVALLVVPGITATSFATALAAAWISAAAATVLVSLATAGTPESLVATVGGRAGGRGGRRGRGVTLPDPDVTGLVFVQLDGVPYPLLRWALQSGLMPGVRRWVDGGSHVLREWTVQLPCTTPASQLGILHGTHAGVPAFRWYDRELGRLLVANRPADARVIEERASDGRGLLADDGVSVSNLFSGDAARCSMVMSRVGPTRGRFETRQMVARFMVRPDGLARSVSRAVAEVARERHQAARQRRRGVVPRIRRPWAFTGLRAVTNGLLRDLNVAVVAEAMMAGRRSVYVDFVDFDEVAHHAGPVRLEALAVLAELDTVVSTLTRLAERAPRPYEFVLLSDHGQALGMPFEERHGQDLAEVCRGLMGREVAWVGESVEGWGRVGALAEDVAEGDGGLAGSVAQRVRQRQAVDEPVGQPDPVVLGSGNLGLVYAGGDDRLTLEDIDARWPALVPGLAAHPGISVVAGLSAAEGPVVIGDTGRCVLRTGYVAGDDPLADLPDHAGQVLLTALEDDRAPDLYVNSSVDPGTAEVAAFEDLVGSHGGLGGWQDRGMVVAPTQLWREGAPVLGADALHRELVAMLEKLGHRGTDSGIPPAPTATPRLLQEDAS